MVILDFADFSCEERSEYHHHPIFFPNSIPYSFYAGDEEQGITKDEFFTAGKAKGATQTLLEETWEFWQSECMMYTTSDEDHWTFCD